MDYIYIYNGLCSFLDLFFFLKYKSGYTYSSRQRRFQHHYNYIHQNISLYLFAYCAFLFTCSPLVFTVSQTFLIKQSFSDK